MKRPTSRKAGWLLGLCACLAFGGTAVAEEVNTLGSSFPAEPVYSEPSLFAKWFHRGGHRGAFSHRADLVHSHPDDPMRHIGLGQPLVGTSWRNRPFHVDAFAGTLLLQNLVSGEIEQSGAFFDGIRLGYDFDHYWGSEIRLGFAEGRLSYVEDEEAEGENRLTSGKSQVVLLDYSVQFYPWGDSKWRPYATLGLGTALYQYDDALGRNRDEAQVSMPWGIGLKYLLHRRFALRVEMLDNLTFGGSGVDAANNFSFTGGFEYRFGGSRPSYFD